MHILVVNGPNMNMLGIRQPEIYGHETYEDLKALIRAEADRLGAVGIPTVEVHVSDPDSREEFRRVSYIRAACAATIRGHGLQGYVEALRFLCGADA